MRWRLSGSTVTFRTAFTDAVASFKTLPERMNPTLSECN